MGTDSSRLCPPSSLQFDSGVHYVGARSILAFLLSWITQSPIHFAPLGRSENCFAYDIIDMDGVRVTYRGAGGRQGIEKELCEKFPHESAGIRSYLQESGERAGTGSASLLLLKLLPRAAVSSAKVRTNVTVVEGEGLSALTHANYISTTVLCNFITCLSP